MRRSTRTTATTLAMLVLVAAGSVASDDAAAQWWIFVPPGSGGPSPEQIVEGCKNSFKSSFAYDLCGDRVGASGETFEAEDDTCVITTSCVFNETVDGKWRAGIRNTSWRGNPFDAAALWSCTGELTLTAC